MVRVSHSGSYYDRNDPAATKIIRRWGPRLPINIDIEYTAKAIVGIASPVLGVVTSFQEQIEWHLRIASLLVGLAVGILSLVAMARKMRRK